MIKTTIKQQLNNIYELENEKNKKITLKQEKEQKQQELLNDINYIIDNIIIELRNDNSDNLYYMYSYYLKSKDELLERILNEIKSQTIEVLQEIPTNKGFEFKKVLISKHNITLNNIYNVADLIENLFDKKINDYIKKKEREKKQLEKLQDAYVVENKSPPKENITNNNLGLFNTGLAISIGIFKGFTTYKHKKRR